MKTLLIKNFVRSKGLMLGLLLLLISGLVSLTIGKQFLEKNAQIIEKTAHYQQENIDRYVQNVNKEMGLLLYYLRFGLVNQTPNLAGLSIGQRDINPSIISVTIRNLEEQKYTTDLMNPMYQLLGNLDFSFVLLYFFPLIIIAFCFNIISEEKEEGTWSLLLTQAHLEFAFNTSSKSSKSIVMEDRYSLFQYSIGTYSLIHYSQILPFYCFRPPFHSILFGGYFVCNFLVLYLLASSVLAKGFKSKCPNFVNHLGNVDHYYSC